MGSYNSLLLDIYPRFTLLQFTSLFSLVACWGFSLFEFVVAFLAFRHRVSVAFASHSRPMIFCPQCYQTAPLCNHGNAPGDVCALFTPDPASVRLASGDYPHRMRAALPMEARTLDAHNIGGYRKPIPATEVLVAEEVNISNEFTTVGFNNVGHALSLGEKWPAHLRSVRTAILNFLNTATTQAHTAICQNGLQELDRLNPSPCLRR